MKTTPLFQRKLGRAGEQTPAPVQTHHKPARVIAQGHRRMRSFSGHFLGTFASAPTVVGPVASFLGLTLRSKRTYYRISEDKIEITEGVFFRRHISVRPSEIVDVWVTRTFSNMLTGDATINIRTRDNDPLTGKRRPSGILEISGLGNKKEMLRIWQEIQNAVYATRHRGAP